MLGAKVFSFQVALLVLLSAGAFGGSKEDAARALLAKSFQQANLWTDGPVKLVAKVTWMHGPVKTVANVTMPRPKTQDLTFTYEIYWAGPDKWRAEWNGAGYSRIRVLNNGKLYTSSSAPPPPVSLFEEALSALSGNSLMGASFSPPLDLSKSKIQVSNEKVGETNAKCVSLAGNTWCIDPVSAHALSFHNHYEGSTLEYEDYAKAGEGEFPQSLRLMFGADVQVESTISVSRAVTFVDSLFAAPPNSTSSDFPSCADMDKNFLPGHLDKKVQPTLPETARMNGHLGTVWLYATIGKDGAIQHLQVIGGSWPELNKSAMDAVQQWKYSPYERCGQPVEVETLILINFFKGGP
jgi:TonB family protein